MIFKKGKEPYTIEYDDNNRNLISVNIRYLKFYKCHG